MIIYSIIPARGGSKGIHKKNIQSFEGQPLLAWAIQAAQESTSINKVYVTTDEPEISEVAQRYGAQVIERPASISGDEARSEDAILHALEIMQERGEAQPDVIVFQQCTNPFTEAKHLNEAIALFEKEQADSLFTAIDCHRFIWQEREGNIEGVNHDRSYRQMRQERPIQYMENGAFYLFRRKEFTERRFRFFGKIITYLMPEYTQYEIDTPSDMFIAEVIFREQRRLTQGNLAAKLKSIKALVFDFDGVHTNNKVIVDQEGRESVICDRSDGLGIARLKAQWSGHLFVLSKEVNPVVRARCQKLQLELAQGIDEKLRYLQTWAQDHQLNLSQIAYLGNDINDLDCMKQCGLAIAPQDAYTSAKAVADILLNCKGGEGAIREFSDLLLETTKLPE